MNNRERENWINNDEGLYQWWKSSRQSMTAFIKQNRDEIDAAIDAALHPKKREARGTMAVMVITHDTFRDRPMF